MTTEPAPPSLPATTILNYISRAEMTPTRVRIVAARFVWIIASLYLLLAGVFAYATVADFLSFGRGASASLMTRLSYFLDEDPALPVCFSLFFTLAVLAATMAGGVKRGRKGPALTAMIAVLPMGLIFLTLGGLLTIPALFVGFGIGDPRPTIHPVWFLWFIPAAIAAALCLLVKDLMAYLLWIARHPDTEKPKIAFLTGKPAA